METPASFNLDRIGRNHGIYPYHEILVELGKEIGLMEEEIIVALNSDEYAYRVKQDFQERKILVFRSATLCI